MNIILMEYALGGALCIVSLYLIKSTLRKRALRFRNANAGTPDPEFDEIRDCLMCLHQTDGTTRAGISPRKK